PERSPRPSRSHHEPSASGLIPADSGDTASRDRRIAASPGNISSSSSRTTACCLNQRRPLMTASDIHQIGLAIGKLVDKLTAKQEELRRCEGITGRGYPLRKINRLRDEIARLEQRIQRAERLQDSTLRGER